jgi:hypothetical protein
MDAEQLRIFEEESQLAALFGGLTVLKRFTIGSKESRLVRIQPESDFMALLKATLFVNQKEWPFHERQGWGIGVFNRPAPIEGIQPAFFGVITDGVMPTVAALLHKDVISEIDPDAPRIVLERDGWVAGLPDAFEHDTPLDVQALGDACFEAAGQIGLTKIHLVTGVPPAGTTRILGRTFTQIAAWDYRKKFPVIAVEMPLAA